MPSVVLTNASAVLGASDISAYTQSITLDYDADAVVETAMGDTTKKHKGGVKGWSVTIEAKQDFAAAALDSILFPLVGTTFTFTGRPDAAASVSASNPQYSGTALFTGYSPIKAGHGELAKTTLKLVSGGTLARATA